MTDSRPHRYDLASFFSKVEVDEKECWVWRAAVNGGSGACYGVFRGESAHRTAYRWFVGQIPSGYHVDHLCRNSICVNPGHLEAVTQRENSRRASVFEVTGMCKRGHVATPETVGTMKQGGGRTARYCRVCRKLGKAS